MVELAGFSHFCIVINHQQNPANAPSTEALGDVHSTSNNNRVYKKFTGSAHPQFYKLPLNERTELQRIGDHIMPSGDKVHLCRLADGTEVLLGSNYKIDEAFAECGNVWFCLTFLGQKLSPKSKRMMNDYLIEVVD